MTMTRTEKYRTFAVAVFVFAMFMTASVATAQFPTKKQMSAKQSPLVGHWVVTNIRDTRIEIELKSDGTFRMALPGGLKNSGTFDATPDSIELNFSDGQRQTFDWQRSEQGLLRFVNQKENSVFEMRPLQSRIPAETSTDSTDEYSDDSADGFVDETADSVTAPVGTWYGQLVGGPITVLVKMSLTPQGKYETNTIVSFNGQTEKDRDHGSWSIQDDYLVSKSEKTGGSEKMPFKLENGELIVDATAVFGTHIRLNRDRNKVTPTRFDVQKLASLAGQ